MITPALQRWPFQLLPHGGYAGLSAVVAGNISGLVPLSGCYVECGDSRLL